MLRIVPDMSEGIMTSIPRKNEVITIATMLRAIATLQCEIL